jgi:outer membrane immunogenic protein
MRRLIVAALSIAALYGAPAHSADLAVKAPAYVAPTPVANWTGFYVGIEGGGNWGRSTHDYLPFGTHGPFDVSGGLVGGTIGYNQQMGQFLAGIEGDLSWASSSGSTPGAPTSLCTGGPCTTKLTWLSTVRGRLGYVAGMWLPYITGGGAFGNVNTCENLTCASATYSGWTLGGGVEAMFAPNWSAKLEYLYADFGSQNAYVFIVPHHVSLNENIVRAGVNYKFGGPVVARY